MTKGKAMQVAQSRHVTTFTLYLQNKFEPFLVLYIKPFLVLLEVLNFISPVSLVTYPNMARLVLISFLVLFHAVFLVGTSDSAPHRHSSSSNFIKASCRATQYPALCVQCLAGYARSIQQSERQLAQTALAVSLSRVRKAESFVAKLKKVRNIKPREYRAVKDCIEVMADGVDRLGQSVRELGHAGRTFGQEFMWHMSNVQTWVSAALTDETTCFDGFAGRFMDGNVKVAIRRRVNNVAQVTSNALALVNRYATKHGAVVAANEP